jgi:hypothetical protein
MWPPK